MAKIVATLGLSYYEGEGEAYYSLNLFNKGDSHKIFNTISGSKNGCHVSIFDYTYTTGSGKNKRTHKNSVCLLNILQCFPDLFIRPENIIDKIAGVIGLDDIDFESKEFSNRFYVKSSDKKFAYAVIHPQMMNYLLAQPKAPLIEIKGPHIGCYYTKKIKPTAYLELYAFAESFYKNIPDYALKDYATQEV